MWLESRVILERAKTFVGVSCLVATLLLLSPGVTIVRADGAEPASKKSSATENSSTIAANPTDRASETTPEVLDPAAAAAAGRPVVLNTRGYNYGPARPPARPAMLPTREATPTTTPTQPGPKPTQ